MYFCDFLDPEIMSIDCFFNHEIPGLQNDVEIGLPSFEANKKHYIQSGTLVVLN